MKTKKLAANLPQTNSTWYVFYSLLRTWVADEGQKPVRPHLFIVMDLASQFILNFELLGTEPTVDQALEIIQDTMVNPKMQGAPQQRPKKIKFENKLLADEISDSLSEIDVAVRFAPDRRLSSAIIQDYQDHANQGVPEIEGLSSSAGIPPTALRGFYQAAAEFYRAEPWVYLSDNNVLSISIPPHEPYLVTLMGQAGMEYGIAVYKNREDLEAIYQLSDEETPSIPAGGWHSITFEEKYVIPFDDLDEIELHAFEIAAENAYPFPITYLKDDGYDRPSREMIFWYQGTLQALAKFTALYFKSDGDDQSDKTRFQFEVTAGQKKVEAEIIYPVEGIPLVGYVPPIGDISPMEMMGLGDFGHGDADLRAAQEIIYDAWEEVDPAERIKMAQKALEVSEFCIDAYVILAEDLAATNQEMLNYYQKGVEAGEQYFGKGYFKENQGYFWGLIETRPYMRALGGQANCLWVTGEKPKALEIYYRMLTLNPGDNQGIRYLLLDALLEMKRYEDAEALIKEYKEVEDAVWLFTKALLKYKDVGQTPASNKLLKKAHRHNPFVKTYLTGKKRIPHDAPNYYGWGDENEAILYAKDHLNHWRKIPGAVDWLESIAEK